MLKNCKNETEWDSLTDEDYITFTKYGDPNNAIIGIIFRCPGCSKLISINEGWKLDLSTMTVTPSILHDKKKGGCGWHGYLTNGELNGKIE